MTEKLLSIVLKSGLFKTDIVVTDVEICATLKTSSIDKKQLLVLIDWGYNFYIMSDKIYFANSI